MRSACEVCCQTLLLLLVALQFIASIQAADNDFAAPIISITSHANGQIVNTKTVVLSGTATDAGKGDNGISSVYARGTVPNATTAGNGVVTWIETITLNPGPNYIDVYAYDNSENKNFATTSITINFQPVDSIPPSISVTSHQNGQIVNTKTITLSGTATDAGTGDNGVSSVYVRGTVPGAVATGAGTAAWSQPITLYPGANYIDIWAYDNSDVQNAKVITVTINFQPVDALPPTITLTSHTNGETVHTSTIELQGTATDAGRGNNGISSVWVSGTIPNATAIGADTVTWSKSLTLHPGANYLSIYAYDNSDVQNEAHQEFTINFQPADTLAPNLTITSHTNGTTVFTSSITLTGTASDAGRGDNGIAYVYARGRIPNSNTAGGGTVQWSQNIDLSPGVNLINVSAYDNNEFPNEADQAITINFQAADTLGPNLTISSPLDGQTVNSKTITIRGTASDAGRGDNGISYVSCFGRIDGATVVGADTVNWSRTVDLTPGKNVITVVASDNSPFPSSTTQTITITFQPADSLPPSLIVTSHTDGQIVFTNVITIAGTASDAGRGDNGISAVHVNFKLADNSTAVGAGVAAWSRTLPLNPGLNSIYISATDASEFQQETNLTLKIVYQIGDLAPPLLSIDSPRNGQTFTTSSLLVSGTATDAGAGGSGVAEVTVNGTAATGGTVTGTGTANWTRAIELVQGANVISVVATDGSSARNSVAQTVTVTYDPVDSTPPVIEITSHRNNQTVTTSSIVLEGTATDAGAGGSGIASVTVNGTRAGGDTAAGSAIANWSRTVALIPGPNVISVIARDNSPKQNDAAASITVVYDPTDTAGPEVSVTSHRKGQIVATASIVLAGTATDSGHGNNGIAEVTVNGQAATGGTAVGAGAANWTSRVDLQLGPNVISIVARDNSAAHNSTADGITIIYEPEDHTPPEVTITSHKNGQTVPSSSVILMGTATDADLGDNGILSVSVNGLQVPGATAAGAAQARWSQPLLLNLGDNVISVVAQDTKGNSAAKTITLTYDPHFAVGPSEFCWVRSGGGAGVDGAFSISVDGLGNSYIAGSFEGSALFGSTNLTSRGLTDIFVAKYDPNGDLLWARQAGGTNVDAAFGITTDASGNAYVTGYFSGRAQVSETNLVTTGDYDLFLAKYDSDGRLLWTTTTGQSRALFGSAIALDSQGSCYVAGSFSLDASFSGTDFQNNQNYDGFLAKFSRDGVLLWAEPFGGDGDDQANGVAVGPDGHVSVTGYFTGLASFGDGELESVGDHDMFLSRWSSEGQLEWVQQAGAVGKTQGAGVAVDANGNALVTGSFSDLSLFGTNTISTDAFADVFLAKYQADGNLLWVRNTESSGALSGAGVAVDNSGNSFVVGSFSGPVTFGQQTFTNYTRRAIFLANYDTDGNVLWAKQAGGASDNAGYAIAVDPVGTCYLAGMMSGLVNFGTKTLNSSAKSDAVLAKLLNPAGVAPASLSYALESGPQFQVRFTADQCGTYRLQASSDLRTWSTVATNLDPSGTASYTDLDVSRNGRRFFRVVSP